MPLAMVGHIVPDEIQSGSAYGTLHRVAFWERWKTLEASGFVTMPYRFIETAKQKRRSVFLNVPSL